MNKMNRDRSIFIVISCIVMAAIMLHCSAAAPSVRLKTEHHARLGTQAAVSFGEFFEAAQDWYAAYPAEESFTLTLEEDYEPLLEMFAAVSPYLTAAAEAINEDPTLADPALAALNEYTTPLYSFVMNYPIQVAMLLESYGSYPMDASIWDMIGTALDETIAYYQN